MTLIKTETEHSIALARLSYLMDQDPAPGSELADELELLTLLTGHYEQSMVPPVKVTPIEMILFRMEQMQMKRKDLVPYIGSLSKVSEVLSGKRPLSLSMIRRLHKGLHIAPEILLQPTPDEPTPDDGADTESGWQPGTGRIAPHQSYPGHVSTAWQVQQERSPYQVTPLTDAAPFGAEQVRALRTRLDVSQAVLAHYLHTDANTVGQWEQGQQQPNAQAVLLMRLLHKFPDLAAQLALLQGE